MIAFNWGIVMGIVTAASRLRELVIWNTLCCYICFRSDTLEQLV